MVCKWLAGLFVGGMLLFLTGCGGPGGEECGGIDDLVSCVSITSIQPTATAGGESSNVDAVRDICDVDQETGEPILEPFTDHNATITFSNSSFPGASETGLSVTLRSVSISYSLNDCPDGAVCPPLSAFTQDVTLTIPAGGSASGTFPFVPLRVKEEFVALGGDVTAYPSYNANYVFIGQTDLFNDTVTIRGSAEFTIGNFDLCSG
jgi:hypothetical protein